ncbi:MAG: type II secretion system protein [Planctomycetota bacterium]|jgi:prepilin-type N-terminal cleavage/methylation domain-containing protein
MRRAFTIVELLAAMGLLGVLLAVSGVIFGAAVKAYRTAEATAQISRKLAAITDQLNSDFMGLRKEGEIFAIWVAKPVDSEGNVVAYNAPDIAGYERFDRIMFFADGDFQSYREWFVDPCDPHSQVLSGNVARICYMLARDGDDVSAEAQEPRNRILSRTQHIFTGETIVDEGGVPLPFPVLSPFDPCDFAIDNFVFEYDTTTLQQWKNIALGYKEDMLSVISGVDVRGGTGIGTSVSTSDPATIHMLLCQGVGQFSVEGWYDLQQRWVPYLEWDEDGQIVDTDFIVDGSDPTILHERLVPGVLYPYRVLPPEPGDPPVPPWGVYLRWQGPPLWGSIPWYSPELVNEANFNSIPGLGRALKFTFTLYDSQGIFEEGKTFTHIVYLGD